MINHTKTQESSKGCCLNEMYFIESRNICVSCPNYLNCKRCDSDNVCAVCKEEFNISSNVTEGCISCSKSLKCQHCDTANICSICMPNYFINVGFTKGCC